MRVHFYATLRDLAGVPEVEVEMGPGATVRVVFEWLVERYPGLAGRLFDESGELSPHLLVHVSGWDILLGAGLDTPLKPDDRIRIFMQIAGG